MPAPAFAVRSTEVRPPASRPEAVDVERRQPAAPRLRRADLLQAKPPVAGGIGRRAPDRRVAVGDSGKAEAGRDEIERGQRHRGRARAKIERRACSAGEREAARIDAQGEVLDRKPILAVSQRRRSREGDRAAGALRGKSGEVQPDRRAARQASLGFHGEAAHGAVEGKVGGIALALGGEPDVGDGLPADFRPRERG